MTLMLIIYFLMMFLSFAFILISKSSHLQSCIYNLQKLNFSSLNRSHPKICPTLLGGSVWSGVFTQFLPLPAGEGCIVSD